MSRTKLPGHSHYQNFPDIDPGCSLIGPGDPPPFMTYNDHGRARVLLVADHATPFFPAAMNQLGLADWVLERHVAWDIGSDELTRCLADELDAPAVLAGFSRLIVDPNRRLDDPSAFVEISDGIAIPGNLDLDEQEKHLRAKSFYAPYHDAIAARLAAFEARGIVPALISIHTCTPVFDRVVRPWHIGVMWDKDPRIPVPLIAHFNGTEDVCIGDNEPYSGRHPHDFTIDHHAEPAGLPHVGIEVRQDLVDSAEGAREWARILADGLRGILADDRLYQVLEESDEVAAASQAT
ncbi:MAG: N-formylglutamate amidohydrolase [Xanthomonadales bacterium]|nr:N-formylglutamate amidohydrolase [Gammaproteobacteria bacterium]NNJ65754.1 N-formylglutamate amidohydrolase [Xanthomonadales bacterium]